VFAAAIVGDSAAVVGADDASDTYVEEGVCIKYISIFP
jgi:hypothetical protein